MDELYSQTPGNIVPNGDFENVIGCPKNSFGSSNFGQFTTNWDFLFGNPDYYHTNGVACGQSNPCNTPVGNININSRIPDLLRGQVDINTQNTCGGSAKNDYTEPIGYISGNDYGFAGLRNFLTGNEWTHEYAKVKLDHPLFQNVKYFCELFVTKSDQQGFGNVDPGLYGMLLSSSEINNDLLPGHDVLTQNLGFVPQVSNTTQINDNFNWQTINGIVTGSEEEFIYLGYFPSTANPLSNPDSYFYVDSVQVMELCPSVSGPSYLCTTSLGDYSIENFIQSPDLIYNITVSPNGTLIPGILPDFQVQWNNSQPFGNIHIEVVYGGTVQCTLDYLVKFCCDHTGYSYYVPNAFNTSDLENPGSMAYSIFTQPGYYNVNNNTLTTNALPFVFNGNINVNSDITFLNCKNLLFKFNTGINCVSPSIPFQINVLNTTLRAACDVIWNGIFVTGNNVSINFSGSTVMEAKNGLSVAGCADFVIANSDFLNNYQHVVVSACNYFTGGNTATARSSVFDCNVPLLSPYNGQLTLNCFNLRFVQMQLGATGSYSDLNILRNARNGVYKAGGRLVAYHNLFEEMHRTPGWLYTGNGIYDRQNTSGLSLYGLVVGGGGQYQPNQFYHCDTAIYSRMGLQKILDNRILNCSRGVKIVFNNNSPASTVVIDLNLFWENETSIELMNNSFGNLEIHQNDIWSREQLFFAPPTRGIFMNQTSCNTASLGSVANNNIYSGTYGIDLHIVNNMIFSKNLVQIRYPQFANNKYCIRAQRSNYVTFTCNQLFGRETVFGQYPPFFGVDTYFLYECEFICNLMDTFQQCMKIGVHTINTNLIGNRFDHCENAIELDPACNLPDQGSFANNEINGNEWINQNISGWGLTAPLPISTTFFGEEDNGNIYLFPLTRQNVNYADLDLPLIPACDLDCLIPGGNLVAGGGGTSGVDLNTALGIINDEIEFPVLDEEIKYSYKIMLYDDLAANDSITESIADLEEFKDSTQNNNIGIFEYYESAMRQAIEDAAVTGDSTVDLAPSIGNAMFAAVQPVNPIDEYLRYTSWIYAAKVVNGLNIDSADISQLSYIAGLCPAEFGEGVFNARAILWLHDDRLDWDNEVICNMQQRLQDAQSEKDEKFKNESVHYAYPNPASTYINLVWFYDQSISGYGIFNSLGKQVMENSVSAKEHLMINLPQSMPDGVYYVRLIANDKATVFRFVKMGDF